MTIIDAHAIYMHIPAHVLRNKQEIAYQMNYFISKLSAMGGQIGSPEGRLLMTNKISTCTKP